EGEYNSNLSGYVAISIVNKYLKPCIILRKNKEGVLTGSLRGYDPLMMNTKDFLEGLEIFDWNRGHQNAHGVQIQPHNVFILDATISESLADNEVNESYLIDFELHEKSGDTSFIEKMEELSHLWGSGIDQPLYAIKNVELKASEIILMGKTQNVLKFNKNNVEYVQFAADETLADLKESGKTLVLDVIGKTKVN